MEFINFAFRSVWTFAGVTLWLTIIVWPFVILATSAWRRK